jgi:hypothetical protein
MPSVHLHHLWKHAVLWAFTGLLHGASSLTLLYFVCRVERASGKVSLTAQHVLCQVFWSCSDSCSSTCPAEAYAAHAAIQTCII